MGTIIALGGGRYDDGEVMPIFEAADEKKRSFLLMVLSDLSKDYDKCIH